MRPTKGLLCIILMASSLALPANTTMSSLECVYGHQNQQISTSSFLQIGYYVNSSSEYANGAYHLVKHGNIGNLIVPLTDLSNLNNLAMAIIPYKLSWTTEEIESVTQFVQQGGIAFVTVYSPPELIDLQLDTCDGYWRKATEESAASEADQYWHNVHPNYSDALKDTDGTIHPFDNTRETKFLAELPQNSEITAIHYAYANSELTEFAGYATVMKQQGDGQIVFSAASIFDLWAMRATGGPTLDSTVVGSLRSGHDISQMLSRLIPQLFLMQGISIPTKWHVPQGKHAFLASRDDVDRYVNTSVEARGEVDRAHGIPTAFYDLRGGIPTEDWPKVLDADDENPLGYHIPGYHRHTAYEEDNSSYLQRIIELESQTEKQILFECHHGGGGSGFFGQDYVRTAIEATNSLTHPIVYTSSEGGQGNAHILPFLYLHENGTVKPASNYYSHPKSMTIDTWVSGHDIETFAEYVDTLLGRDYQVHWLLHSQGILRQLPTRYNDLLTGGIDPHYEEFFTDPNEFVRLSLDYSQSVSISFHASNADELTVNATAAKTLDGYTFAIPLPVNHEPSEVLLDGTELPLGQHEILDRGYYNMLLVETHLSEGTHELAVKTHHIAPATTATTAIGSSSADGISFSNLILITMMISVQVAVRARAKRHNFTPQ